MMRLLSPKEAAEALGVSVKVLRGHVRDGNIAYIVTGLGKIRPAIAFDQKDLQEFIDRDKPAPPPPPPPPPPPASVIDFRKERRIRGQKVYFIRAGDTIKIGIAVDPKIRLSTLQVARPDKLELLLVLPGGAPLERKLHERFGDLALSGEWFRYEGRLRIFIERRLERCR